MFKFKSVLFCLVVFSFFGCKSPSKSLSKDQKILKFNFKFVEDIIIVPVEIQGNEYNFAFDTGAYGFVTERLSNEVETKFIDSVRAQGLASKSDLLPRKFIKDINLGQFRLTRAPLIVVEDFKNFSDNLCLEIDGLFGSEMMHQFAWKINYDNQVISLFSKAVPDNEKRRHNYKLKLNNNPSQALPIINFMAGNYSFPVLLDTGSNSSLKLNNSDFNTIKNKKISTRKIGIQSLTLNGVQKDTTYLGVVKDLTANGNNFKKINTEFSSSASGRRLIGNKLLQKSKSVIFDFPNKDFYAKKSFGEANLVKKSFGFSPYFYSEYIIVGAIIENSPADRKGLAVGDTLQNLNDKNLMRISNEDWCNYRPKFQSASKLNLNTSNGKSIQLRKINVYSEQD